MSNSLDMSVVWGTRSFRTSLAAILALGLGATPANAAPDGADAKVQQDAKDRARELFKLGAASARQERWLEALQAFEQSILLHPHPSTAYNIGYCERALGHYTRALRAFRQALAAPPATSGLSPQQRTEALQYQQEAELKLAKLRVTLHPANASITVDGRPLAVVPHASELVLEAGVLDPGKGVPPPDAHFVLWIDPGSHTFALEAPGHRAEVVTYRFVTGSTRKLVLRLQPAGATDAPGKPMPEPERAYWSQKRVWAVGLAGASVASAGVATFFGIRAATRWDRAQDACPDASRCPDDRGASLSASARRDGNLATVAVAAAAGAFAGATVLWLDADSAPKSELQRAKLQLGVGSIANGGAGAGIQLAGAL